MKHILNSLKSEFITIHDGEKKYVIRTWHFSLAMLVLGFLIG